MAAVAVRPRGRIVTAERRQHLGRRLGALERLCRLGRVLGQGMGHEGQQQAEDEGMLGERLVPPGLGQDLLAQAGAHAQRGRHDDDGHPRMIGQHGVDDDGGLGRVAADRHG